jgi:hypothetical protein
MMNVKIEDLNSEEVLEAILPLQGFVNERKESERRIIRDTTRNISDFTKIRSEQRLKSVLKTEKILDQIYHAALLDYVTPNR